MLKVLSNILCDLDPKVKVIGQKAGICDGVPSTSALVEILMIITWSKIPCYCTLLKLPEGATEKGAPPSNFSSHTVRSLLPLFL